MTTVTRSETTKVYRNWRESAGGRVLTFDLMLEMPRSSKVDGLPLNSDIVFEGKRYVVNSHAPIIGTAEGTIRLMLMAAGEAVLSDLPQRKAA